MVITQIILQDFFIFKERYLFSAQLLLSISNDVVKALTVQGGPAKCGQIKVKFFQLYESQ